MWDRNSETNEIELCHGCPGKLGCTYEELDPINYTVFEKLTHPEDMPKLMDAVDKHLKGLTENFECDFRMKHKNGHWVWFSSMSGVIERDKFERPLKLDGVNIDISWRKEL